MKILHIGDTDTFIPPFIEFVKENFDFSQHRFLLTGGGMAADQVVPHPNVDVSKPGKKGTLMYLLRALVAMQTADKIILHGLFNCRIVQLLFLNPWLLKKCYWVLWGGDLYVYQLGERNWKWKRNEFFRRRVIKKMKCITTTVPGDYELARDWYDTKAYFKQNLMYDSHVSRDVSLTNDDVGLVTNIQVGNSADPTNNHIQVFHMLAKCNSRNIRVYCPLSYGSDEYAEKVICEGKSIFGEKFIPLVEFMTFNEYSKYLGSIDVSIFNHNRQQAMGNIIALLSLGKKVVLRENITPYAFFKSIGLKVYTFHEESIIEKMPKALADKNKKIAASYFTKNKLISDWEAIFNE